MKSRAEIIHGECIEVMRSMKDESFDAVVTDPSYNLTFMGRKWDHFSTPRDFQEWCEEWARETFRVLRPGGHILSFGGSKTYHRMACGIEDAGFEIRDSLMWLQAQGFLKSTDVSKGIDKEKGVKRKVKARYVKRTSCEGSWAKLTGHGRYKAGEQVIEVTEPTSPEAKEWDGWGSGLKPAFEPIIVGRKPLGEKNIARNVLVHGTGAINIGGCRIGVEIVRTYGKRKRKGIALMMKDYESPEDSFGHEYVGRWPANIILSCACDDDDHDPECPVAMIDSMGDKSDATGQIVRTMGKVGGGLSRVFYVAKVHTTERNMKTVLGKANNIHPSVKPIMLMQWLCRLVTPRNGRVLDPFLGSGSTMIAAMREGFRCTGIELDEESVETSKKRLKLDCPLFNRVRIRTHQPKVRKRVRIRKR